MIPDLDRLAELAHAARASAADYQAATDRLREAMGMTPAELAVMRDRIRALAQPEPTEADRCAMEGHPQLDCSTHSAGGSICRCGSIRHDWKLA